MRLLLAFLFFELCPLWLKLGKLGKLIRSGRQLPLPRVRHHLTKFHFLAASQSLHSGEAESVPFHKVRRRKCNAGASRGSAGFDWTTSHEDLRSCIPTHDSLVIGRTGCTLATHSLHSCPKGGATYESPCFVLTIGVYIRNMRLRPLPCAINNFLSFNFLKAACSQ